MNLLQEKFFPCQGKVLTQFFDKCLKDVTKNYILVQLKTFNSDQHYNSISTVQTIDKTMFNTTLDIFPSLSPSLARKETREEFYLNKAENYKGVNFLEIIIAYKILPLDCIIKKSKLNYPDKSISTLYLEKKKDVKHFGFNFPNTMDYTQWGKIVYEKNNFIIIEKLNSKARYYVWVHNDRLFNFYNLLAFV